MRFSFSRLLGLFILIPITELYLLLKLAKYTSPLTTFAVIIVTGVLGAYFSRQQGRAVLSEINQKISDGAMPADSLIDGLCVLIGGVLLLTPGILTDIMGFALIFPLTRAQIAKKIKHHYHQRIKNGSVYVHTNLNFNSVHTNTSNARCDDDDDIVIIDNEN